MTNVIVYGNDAWVSGDDIYNGSDSVFGYCCAADGLTAGVNGNITADPAFTDAGSGYGTNVVPGNYRMRGASPCVNTGLNRDWMIEVLDLDGNARMDRVTRRVDMGCFEYMPHGTFFRVR